MTYDDYEAELNQIRSALRREDITDAQAYRYTEDLQDAWEVNSGNNSKD